LIEKACKAEIVFTVMATALAQNGAKVIIASRKEKALKEVADKLNGHSQGSCE
jgi:short-subunit dehydrogenase